MKNYQITQWCAAFIRQQVQEGDFCIDATMGNGNDTLLLSQLCGKSGKVLAFDIQQEALDATRIYLSEHGIADPERTNIRLICDSHTEIDRYLAEVPGEISAFVFNLGFMPGRDKTIMTTEDTSLPAIKKAINLVKTGGIVSVMAYSGHKEGEAECAAIYEFLKTLPSKKYHVAYVHMINQKKTAPSLFLVTPKVEGRKPL